MIGRRDFLTGLAAAITGPYIARSGILMPVRAIIKPRPYSITEVSMDGENWVALAFLNIKAGREPHYMLKEQAAAFPYQRVVFARGWTA